MAGEFLAVVDHEALFQVPCTKLHGHVEEENDVGKTVTTKPHSWRQLLQLGQTLTHNQRPQIVKHAKRQHHQPVEVEVLVRVHHRSRRLLQFCASATTTVRAPVTLGRLRLGSVQRLLTLRQVSRRETF